MDAGDDRDLLVQRQSSDLLEELIECIPRFVYRHVRNGQRLRSRRHLSGAALTHIFRLLDLFQESPQLLDPSLDKLVNPLNNAFLDVLTSSRDHPEALRVKKGSKFCLPQVVCTILYTLCKIRGSKVITRFLSNEARHLELIVDTLETWTPNSENEAVDFYPLVWEERYVLVLWLSHLVLTPFDLSTVGTDTVSREPVPEFLESLDLSPDVPNICQRLLRIAISNLASSSKERESAALLLVRLSLRPDMRLLDLHRVLIHWAVSELKILQKAKKQAGYLFIGLLSFLADIVKSADALVISPFLAYIFNSVEQLSILQSGSSSALTRKAVIKIYSACSVTALTLENQPDESLHFAGSILENVIDELLSALGDKDTPVRQAASKALSMVAVKLDPIMAADISEAVISGLEENVLWETVTRVRIGAAGLHTIHKQRNLTLVDAARWQGLTLTLAQLLFRRCPPVTQLPAILNSLILALGFEQRSSSGASMGTSVRDAACFGIWAIARRYTTAELLSVDMSSIFAAHERGDAASIIQLLATELIVTSALDPAGNIRRGASAALQELTGRHPDTIANGISLVQIVDYHAVALRSRAMQEVAETAARLDEQYWTSILTELMTWRGIGATDVESRRLAAQTIGRLSISRGHLGLPLASSRLLESLDALNGGTVQKRQGCVLGAAALARIARDTPVDDREIVRTTISSYWTLFLDGGFLSESEMTMHTARPELMTEAVATLVYELATSQKSLLKLTRPEDSILENCFRYMGFALERREQVVIDCAVKAMKALFEVATPDHTTGWIDAALSKTRLHQNSTGGVQPGYLLALSGVHSSSSLDTSIKVKILQQLIGAAQAEADIDTRVLALQGLTRLISDGPKAQSLHRNVVQVIQLGLQDYTTDQRGDVGSLLRLEAINAVLAAFTMGALQETPDASSLLQYVCVLAGEKLDKVRLRAWSCLTLCWDLGNNKETDKGEGQMPTFAPISVGERHILPTDIVEIGTVSNLAYFESLLDLLRFKGLRESVLTGFVVSAGGGAESILVASRKALSKWLSQEHQTHTLQNFGDCVVSILEKSSGDDRVLVPALDTLAYILDTNAFGGSTSDFIRPRKLFALAQTAGFKTTSMAKLLSTIDVYGGLGLFESSRPLVLKKLTNLLTHSYPRIRNAAADSLFMLTQEGLLKPIDWADSTKYTKQALANVKEALKIV